MRTGTRALPRAVNNNPRAAMSAIWDAATTTEFVLSGTASGDFQTMSEMRPFIASYLKLERHCINTSSYHFEKNDNVVAGASLKTSQGGRLAFVFYAEQDPSAMINQRSISSITFCFPIRSNFFQFC